MPPLGLRTAERVGKVGKCAVQGYGEPVARRLADADLLLDVISQVRQRVALAQAAFRGNVLIASRKRDRLEGHEIDLVGVVDGESYNRAHLVVVHAVDDRDDRDDANARFVQVLDGTKLDVEQVPDLAVTVGIVADPVKLEVGQP